MLGRLGRYAYDGGFLAGIALALSAALWMIFFVLRWVAWGFKSEA